MANAFVHVELNTNDIEKAKTFYSQMFKWQLEDLPMGPSGTYTMIKPEAQPHRRGRGVRMLQRPTEVPGAGTMAVIVDPTGAMLALWKPKPR